MDQQAPNYHGEFLRSPHHAGLGLLTLGLGFVSGNVLGLIIGATLYALGWIYLPDLGLFRGWVDRRRDAVKRAEEEQKVQGFIRRRDALLDSLSPSRRERYSRLAAVCRDIETASADNPLASADATTDPRLRKLDELMWTYLRLLGIEESLEKFLETERRDDLPGTLKEAEAEAVRLTAELDALKAKGNGAALDTKQRYVSSRLERLEVLRKRQQRLTQAQENLALVVSEQDRLDQQIKLIHADAVATKNADALTARIDATVEHLDQTNKWLSELDEFKDLVADMPATDLRVGYQALTAPPVLEAHKGYVVQDRRQRIRVEPPRSN
jgi:phage repressor protein C with HTH and peptisase S24 domain